MVDGAYTHKYTYSPLPTSNSIRLLCVKATESITGRITISGTFISRHLSTSHPEYSALSYSWGRNSDGDATLSYHILVDGKELPVTENLHSELRRLCFQREESLVLWVDAICINQEDVDERNAQVAKMAQIYSCASSVDIWLGEGSDVESDLRAKELLDAMVVAGEKYDGASNAEILSSVYIRKGNSMGSFLRSMAFRLGCKLADGSKIFNYVWPRLTHFYLSHYSDHDSLLRMTATHIPLELLRRAESSQPMRNALGQNYTLQLTSVLSLSFEALTALLRRKYFKRRWIIQEIYCARSDRITLWWGPFCYPVRTFIEKVTTIRDLLLHAFSHAGVHRWDWHSPDLSSAWNRFLGFRGDAVRLLRQLTRQSRDLPDDDIESPQVFVSDIQLPRLLKYVLAYQEAECADPRDRLFAFASLADDELQIILDYGLTSSAVFVRFAKALIAKGYLLLIIYMAALSRRRNEEGVKLDRSVVLDLPSWTPDFSTTLTFTDLPAVCLNAVTCAESNEHTKLDASPEASLSVWAIVGKLRSHTRRLDRAVFPTGFEARIICNNSVVDEGCVACRLAQTPWFEELFVLRPVQEKSGYFTLVGKCEYDSDDAETEAFQHLPDEPAELIFIV